MIIYHGSVDLVNQPEIRIGEKCLDFGAGFYVTTSREQAERWARIKMRRADAAVGYVCRYDLDLEKAKAEAVVREFHSADLDWLLFVVRNRRGERFSEIVDMHIGPVADDNVYQSIRFFETGILNAEETVRRLKTEMLHDQLVFHTEKMLSYCTFLDAVTIREGQ